MTNQPQQPGPSGYPSPPPAGAQPGTPYPPGAPGYAPYPGAAYPPAYPPANAAPPVPLGTSTNTVWVWLAVLLPVSGIVTMFLIDWHGMFHDMIAMVGDASKSDTDGEFASIAINWQISLLQQMGWLWGLAFVVTVLSIVFCALDYVQLRKRGIMQQFHWAWVFLSTFFGLGILVWIIGRTVVLRKQKLSAFGPLITYIVVNIAVIVSAFVLVFAVILPIVSNFASQLGQS